MGATPEPAPPVTAAGPEPVDPALPRSRVSHLQGVLTPQLAWAALGFFSAWSVITLEPNMLEEGLVLHIAQRLAHGEHLYRDVVFFTGPLPFELLAVLFRVFGESVFVARGALLVFVAVAAAATFSLARRAEAGALAHVAAAAIASSPVLGWPLLSTYFYTTLGFYLAPIVAYAGLRGLGSARWAFAAGVGIAAIALCKQTFGVALAVGLLAVSFGLLAPERRARHIGATLLGGGSVAALTLLVFAVRGDLGAMVHALALLPFELEGTFRVPYMNLWPLGALGPEIKGNYPLYMPNLMYLRWGLLTQVDTAKILLAQFIYALPFLALIATGVRRIRGPLPAAVWFHTAAQVMLLTNVYPRGDWGHVVFAIPLSVVQLLLLAGPSRDRVGAARLRRVLAVGLCAVLYTGTIATIVWVNTVARTHTYGPRLPLHPVSPSYRADTVPRVIGYLQRRVYEGEEIFVARQEPVLYFATGTRNPTAFPGMMLALRERQNAELLPALRRIRYVVMSDIDQPIYHYYADEMPEVQEFLERYYRVPVDFPIDDESWMVVLERGGDRGPTAFDFVKERGSGRAFRRDRFGQLKSSSDGPRLPIRQLRRPFAIRLGAGGGGVDFDLQVPEDAVFETSLGVLRMTSLEGLHVHPGGARHAVSIARNGGPFQTLRTVRVADSPRHNWMRWQEFRVDLSEYAGESVTLRLEVIAESPNVENKIAWFGSPRLIQSIRR